MRRRAVGERLQHVPEALLGLRLVEVEQREDAREQLPAVDSDRPGADLLPVADEVVRARARRGRVVLHELHVLLEGGGEEVVHRAPALALRVPLEHRELGDEREREHVRVGEVAVLGDAPHEHVEHARADRVLVGDDEQHVAVRRPAGRGQRRQRLLLEEARDGRAHRTVLLVDDPDEAARAALLRERLERVGAAARRVGAAGHGEAAHAAPGLDGAAEHHELAVAHDVGQVADLDAKAQIRLVGAVALHRLRVGHAHERARRVELRRDLGGEAAVQLLHEPEDVVLVDE